ncbi:MAG: SRPBCC family protein [Niabella sp.]|nr:SRPBCC family protein [Niabella sp.]
MKYVRLLIISVVAFLLVISVVTALLPSQVKVSRAANLNTGADSVLNYINDLSRWKYWYPGFDTLQLENTGTQNGKIVKATVKNIQLRIITANDSLVTVEMKKGAQPVYSSWRLIHYSYSDSVTIQNYMDFHFKWYPWERFAGLVLDRSYGPLMEQGLKNLKNGGVGNK